jgi:hypothetical protein
LAACLFSFLSTLKQDWEAFSTNQVHMQVIDGLATISPCIDYQAITTLGDSMLFS